MNLSAKSWKTCRAQKIWGFAAKRILLREFVHRTSFATILKVENGAVLLNVDVRFPYGEDENRIIDTFKKLAESNRGSLIRVSSLPAVYIGKDRPFIKAFAKAYDEVSGRTNEFTLAYGGSYAKARPNIVSWGPVFPDDEDTCHEENELSAERA